MTYDDLLIEADSQNLITKEKPLEGSDGRINDNKIAIRMGITETEKKCALAEELGHHYTTVGNILNQESTEDRKQEMHARMWAYNRMIGLYGIIGCYRAGCRNVHEMAEFLNVTEEFLNAALERYKQKYGDLRICVDNYVIVFEPNLQVLGLI